MPIKDKLGKLFHKKTETVDAVEPVVEPKADVVPAAETTAAAPAEAPVATAITQEVANAPVTAEGVATGESKAEQQAEDEGKVDTIPLGEAELRCLSQNGYEQAKGKFTRSFLIEKSFWMMTETMDPTKPKKMVRVKRAAELRAASAKHALEMIGWDSKNVTVVRETDDFKGEIAVLVDNKPVGKIVAPVEMKRGDAFVPFERLCGSERKQFVADVKAAAMALPEVQAVLSKRERKVSGCAYEHRKHVRLETSKASIFDNESYKRMTADILAQGDAANMAAINAAIPQDSRQATDGAYEIAFAKYEISDREGLKQAAEAAFKEDVAVFEAATAASQAATQEAANAGQGA